MRQYEAGEPVGGITRWHVPFRFLVWAGLAMLLLPACTASDPGPGKHAMVAGHVDFPAGTAAAGADLRVRLKDPVLGGRVLGESTLQGVAGDRIPFVIRYDPRQIVADHAYEVEALVTGAGGSRLVAVAPVEVNPRDPREVQLALSPLAGGRDDPDALEAQPDDRPAPADPGVVVLPARSPPAVSR